MPAATATASSSAGGIVAHRHVDSGLLRAGLGHPFTRQPEAGAEPKPERARTASQRVHVLAVVADVHGVAELVDEQRRRQLHGQRCHRVQLERQRDQHRQQQQRRRLRSAVVRRTPPLPPSSSSSPLPSAPAAVHVEALQAGDGQPSGEPLLGEQHAAAAAGASEDENDNRRRAGGSSGATERCHRVARLPAVHPVQREPRAGSDQRELLGPIQPEAAAAGEGEPGRFGEHQGGQGTVAQEALSRGGRLRRLRRRRGPAARSASPVPRARRAPGRQQGAGASSG